MTARVKLLKADCRELSSEASREKIDSIFGRLGPILSLQDNIAADASELQGRGTTRESIIGIFHNPHLRGGSRKKVPRVAVG